MTKVEFKGQEMTLIFDAGKCWREPESGYVGELDDEGNEYDMTDYIEDECWILEDLGGIHYCAYKSECKVLNIEKE